MWFLGVVILFRIRFNGLRDKPCPFIGNSDLSCHSILQMLSWQIEKRLIIVHKLFVYIGNDRGNMCKGKRKILFRLIYSPSVHQSMAITCVFTLNKWQWFSWIKKTDFRHKSHRNKALSYFRSFTLQLKKREKIPDIECLEQMEMIKNEIDLFLEHHQALCQQTSPSLLDYLRYIKRPTNWLNIWYNFLFPSLSLIIIMTNRQASNTPRQLNNELNQTLHEVDEDYELEIGNYNPVQTLFNDHGISLISLSSTSYNKIDHHLLQVRSLSRRCSWKTSWILSLETWANSTGCWNISTAQVFGQKLFLLALTSSFHICWSFTSHPV